MTTCCENIRGMQSLKISVYPFYLLAQKSKHLQEFQGIDTSVQGQNLEARCRGKRIGCASGIEECNGSLWLGRNENVN